MDYLRTLGSAAVSTLVQKSGLNLPFTLGGKVTQLDGCTLYDGVKKDDGSNVSIFEYELIGKNINYAPLARNALRKLRTIRHPDILKFMDCVESDSTIYIMTERVKPLRPALEARQNKTTQEKEDWLLWGLHRISVALAFINDSCASSHGNVRVESIFITPSGEWKLGGFELLSNPKDDTTVLYTFGHLLGTAHAPPEVQKDGFSALKQQDPAAVDAYALGMLLNETFNPTHHPPASASAPYPAPAASSRFDIPTSIFSLFKKLLYPQAKGRLTAKGFLEIGMADSGFFSSNRLVKVCIGLDGFAVASEAEKTALIRTLNESISSFPSEFSAHRVLPSLLSALEFGGTFAASILPIVIQIGKDVPTDEYQTIMVGPLVKLYASPDRGTRMALLDHLSDYVDKLDKKTVDKIFPHLQTGFSDTVAIIREATVKSIILLAPKFTDRVLNNDLLRHLAKMQSDPEASIRTNTCILIGRLGPTLGYHTKRKVLVPAFSRAIKDVFSHARVAGLMSFMATIECFDPEDVATKVIPSISPSLLDKEKLVRDQAFKAVDLFVKKLEAHATTLPETVSPAETGDLPNETTLQTTLMSSATGAAGALAGWAMSSLGKRLAAGDLQSTMASAPGLSIGRPTSAPPSNGSAAPDAMARNPSILRAASAVNTMTSPPFSSEKGSAKAKGMQLGSNRVSAAALAEQWTEETNDNPWGNDDLMDVNADQDDWSAFETAPPLIAEPKPMSARTPNFTTPSKAPAPKTIDSWSSAGDWDNSDSQTIPTTPKTGPANMSKEEKAAEMTRRKEERKQRIAMLKEQKKNALQS